MTAITTPRFNTDRQDGEVLSFKISNVKIVEGALVSINADGYAISSTDTASTYFAGVAEETVDNTAGSAGDKEIKVRTGGVIQVAAGFSAAQANVGDEVFVEDNATVDVAGGLTNDVYVGRIVTVVSASVLRVALTPFGAKTSDLDVS